MNEREALDVLLARAIDTTGAFGVAPSVRDACSIEAARACNLQDEPSAQDIERFIVGRADTLLAHAGPKAPEIDRLRALHIPNWAFPVLMLLAFIAGMTSHALGDAKRINLLLAPLLIILAWNLVMYIVLAARRFRPEGTIASAAAAWHWRRSAGTQSSALNDALKAWFAHAAPLIDARMSVALHGAAIALAAGAITGMYVRGLGVEYLAGWESTFLDEHGVRRILSVALWAGSLITGIEIGDAARIASLRFRDGSGGAPAGPWIHLYAATATMLIIIPRLALATLAEARARTLTARSPIRLDDPYVRQLLRRVSKKTSRISALPVAMNVDTGLRAALQAALEETLGGRIELTIEEAVPYGESIRAPAHDCVLVFAAAATPEPEVHGALIEATKPVAVVIDETALRRRFGGDASLAHRIDERRDAWRALAANTNLAPVFITAAGQ